MPHIHTPFVHVLQVVEEASGLGPKDMSRAHDKKQTDVDKEANVADAAVGVLGAAASQLPWPQYEQLLFRWGALCACGTIVVLLPAVFCTCPRACVPLCIPMCALGQACHNQCSLPPLPLPPIICRFMKLMKSRPAKPLVRSVCTILDAFHFPLPKDDAELDADAAATAAAVAVATGRGVEAAGAAAAPAAAASSKRATAPLAARDGSGGLAEAAPGAEEDGSDGDNEVEDDAAAGDDEPSAADAAAAAAAAAALALQHRDTAKALALEMQRALLRRVLPALHEQLVDKGDGGAARAPVALAMVKLLKLLPPAAERAELPRTLQVTFAS